MHHSNVILHLVTIEALINVESAGTYCTNCNVIDTTYLIETVQYYSADARQ